MALTEAQAAFFEAFGYLHLPGYMSDELDWICEEHAKLFVEFDIEPDGERTVDLIPFIALSERFTALLEHPKVRGALTPLVGEDFNYLGSDGHYYADEIDFHPDSDRHAWMSMKFGMYLDVLERRHRMPSRNSGKPPSRILAGLCVRMGKRTGAPE